MQEKRVMGDTMDAFEEIIRHETEWPKVPEVDKTFRDIISRVQSLNEQLEMDLPMDRNELRYEVQQLNQRWRSYLKGGNVSISGNAYLDVGYEETDTAYDDEFITCAQEYPVSLAYYPVLDIGFAAIDTARFDASNNRVGEQRIMYVSQIKLDTNEGPEYVIGAARPESIVIPDSLEDGRDLDLTLSPTLQRHFDFTRHSIESADDECDAVLLLKSTVLICGERSDSEVIEGYRDMLNEHLDQRIRFDVHLPYIIEVRNEMSERPSGQREHVPVYLPGPVSLLVSNPSVVAEWDDDDLCKLMLKGVSLTDGMSHVRIPLDSLQSIESSRSRFKDLL